MEILVGKILAGEQKAVETFYFTYAPKLQTYFTKRLPAKEDTEAFTHDTLLEVIDSLPLFEGKSSLGTWLYKIAHNKVVDFYRKRKIKSLLLSQIPYLDVVSREVHNPEFQFEKNKMRDSIEQVLRTLSFQYREILRLHYEEEKSVKEIATLLNISFKSAESRLFRARKSFQKAYEQQ